jgi:pimeloyl-ACP methyl ester carboxylesterase
MSSSSCCCCCPPAIAALFYLWVRSGFSKGSVAGALTFFPPDPPLYKFQRVSKDGNILPDDDSDDDGDDGNDDGKDVGGRERGGDDEKRKKDLEDDDDDDDDDDVSDDDDDDDSDLGTFDIGTNSRRRGSLPPPSSSDRNRNSKGGGTDDDEENERRMREEQRRRIRQERTRQQRQREDANRDPIVVMTERSNRLRRRAKRRSRLDSKDAKDGVSYAFVPRDIVSGNIPSFDGTVHPVKIGPQKRTGTFVAALLYRLKPSDVTPKTKTLLFSHGNATDVGAMAGLQCVIAKNLRCHVLVYDYSGYGMSGGIPMEKNTYRDVKMVYEWVVSNVSNNNESNVILYGQSVGSGPSCYLASRRPDVGGLVLHSPFTSGMRVLTPSRALACLDIFPNIDRIRKVKCRVYILHGREDKEVAFEHGLALQAAVPESCRTEPWWVPNRGHNDIVDGSGIVEYIRRLNAFVRSLDD